MFEKVLHRMMRNTRKMLTWVMLFGILYLMLVIPNPTKLLQGIYYSPRRLYQLQDTQIISTTTPSKPRTTQPNTQRTTHSALAYLDNFHRNITYAKSPEEVNLKEYKTVLTACANAKKEIMLALVDSGFMDMTLNFYETSIENMKIQNYLFIGSDEKACVFLNSRGIYCYVYIANNDGHKASIYNTKEFNVKMNIRTYMILDALKLGFTVLHTDVDIVFFKNPLPDLNTIGSFDLAALLDSGTQKAGTINAGFIYVAPTDKSIKVYTLMVHIARTTDLDDQKGLNIAIADVSNEYNLTVIRLPQEKYMSGKQYFEEGKRLYAGDNPCEKCIVVHDNWLIGKEAKRYRFQETHLWMFDGDQYYSDPTRKYLTYRNDKVKGESEDELVALRNALFIGHILDRIVILPKFHYCEKAKECPLNTLTDMNKFDTAFNGKYRESTFLSHPKVPPSISGNSTSESFWIGTTAALSLYDGSPPQNVKILTPKNKSIGPTASEILNWFGSIEHPVLNFHSLYGIKTSSFQEPGKNSSFLDIMDKAFKKNNYRQDMHLVFTKHKAQILPIKKKH